MTGRGHWFLASAWLALAGLLCGIAKAESMTGRIVAVADGDTVTLLDTQHQLHRIRLAGIDAPEKNQAFGALSKASLSALVFNQDVDVVGKKIDRYGRRVGKIMVADSRCQLPDCPRIVDAGLVQIGHGMAWWYQQYAKEQLREDRIAYRQAESEAQLHLRGLWSGSCPAPPWEWRHARRRQA